MESWHATKFGKYGHLCSAIKTNGWSIHFFAVEVGARGNCASTIRSCPERFRLTIKSCLKTLRSSLKTLSSAALTASFQFGFVRSHENRLFPMLLIALHPQLYNHQYQNHPGILSLNFNTNRIITENAVPITVDWLIKVMHAMWMRHFSVSVQCSNFGPISLRIQLNYHNLLQFL